MRLACLLAFTFGLIQASARPSADGRTPAGRMTDIIERVEGAGTSWHYTYDAAGQLQTVHEGADLRESFTYDFNGNLQVVGAMVSPEVDRRDRLLSFEGDEFVVGYAYNDLGQRTMACKVTCEGVAPWKLWEYTYDALGSLLQAVQFSAANENVEVGGVEYLIGPGGQRFGRRTWTLAPAHPTPGATGSTSTPSTPAPMVGYTYTTVIDWDAGPRTPVATYRTVWGLHDQLDTVNLWLDGNGEVVKRLALTPGEAPDPDDRWLYDAAGRLLAMQSYGQAERRWTWDEGRLVQSSVVGHGNQTTVWAYPGAGVEVIHPGGIVEESVHGWLGAEASRTVTVAGSEELSTLHDHLGRVVSRTTPGIEWVYGHDALGLATAESPAGLWTYTRRADGQLLAVNAPEGPDREYAYDGLGRPLEATVHNGGLVQTLEVGWNGNIPTYSQLGVQRTVHPDGRGRPVHTTWTRNAPPDGDLLSRSIRYDIGDRPLSVDETFEGLATPVVSAYAWDAAGRLDSATEAGAAIDYAYTANSVTISPPWGANVVRTFDGLGRLTGVQKGVPGAWEIDFSLAWDPAGRLTDIIQAGGLSQTRTYGGPGKRLSAIDFSAGAESWSLAYNWLPDQPGNLDPNLPWLQVTADLGGDPEVTKYWLDASERLSRVIYPGTGRRQHDYTWQADGARESETITDPDDEDEPCPCQGGEVCVNDVCASLEEKIGHDFNGLGQLWKIDRFTRHRGEEEWDLDAASHVDVVSDGWGRITEYQTGGINRQALTWDVEGRLLSMHVAGEVGKNYSYRYNWRDQRTHRSGPEGTVASAWEADGLLAEEFVAGANTTHRTHLRGAGMVLGVDGTAFGLDHLGSPVLRWDGADHAIQRFDAWGAHRGGATPAFGEESVGYTSHAFDAESKLTYAQARYYDPTIGAFLSPDPWSGALSHPGTLQKYAYALGNPLQYTDPDGREPWGPGGFYADVDVSAHVAVRSFPGQEYLFDIVINAIAVPAEGNRAVLADALRSHPDIRSASRAALLTAIADRDIEQSASAQKSDTYRGSPYVYRIVNRINELEALARAQGIESTDPVLVDTTIEMLAQSIDCNSRGLCLLGTSRGDELLHIMALRDELVASSKAQVRMAQAGLEAVAYDLASEVQGAGIFGLLGRLRLWSTRGADITLKRPDGVSDEDWEAKLRILNEAAEQGRARVVHSPTRTGTAQRQARREGRIKPGHDADHGLDLQFGGEDSPGNIVSTPTRVNRSVGGQGQQRLQHPEGTRIDNFLEEKDDE